MHGLACIVRGPKWLPTMEDETPNLQAQMCTGASADPSINRFRQLGYVSYAPVSDCPLNNPKEHRTRDRTALKSIA